MKKKLLPILLLVVIVFNFIFCNRVYADPGESATSSQKYGGNAVVEGEAVEGLITEGKDSDGNEMKNDNSPSLLGVALQYVSILLNSFPMTIQSLISTVTMNPIEEGKNVLENVINMGTVLVSGDARFTIERAVFNEVSIFNINVFNQEATYTNGLGDSAETIIQQESNLSFKKSVTTWFYTCRMLAMMINLGILVYVGIRMALSTIASEEAKYKKMLINWLESMVVLFLLHYIMLIIIQLGEIVLSILHNLRYNMLAAGQTSFESVILDKIYFAFYEKSGIQILMYSIFFWFLTFIQLKFFLAYFKRLFSVMFLTIIAPLITVTYPIDKMGDGKAQAFELWAKEYIINVAIQPIHAAIYLIFVFTAGKIAEQAPFVAMIFLLSLGKVETIVRKLFNIQTVSMKHVDEEMKKK